MCSFYCVKLGKVFQKDLLETSGVPHLNSTHRIGDAQKVHLGIAHVSMLKYMLMTLNATSNSKKYINANQVEIQKRNILDMGKLCD